MIGLDTNVLVRYIAQDDPKQAPKANALIDSLSVEAPGFVSLTVVVELVWVLQGCYGVRKEEIVTVLERLLRVPALIVESAEIVFQAVRAYQGSAADFADCIVERSGRHAGCRHTMTFDRKASKLDGMQLIQ